MTADIASIRFNKALSRIKKQGEQRDTKYGSKLITPHYLSIATLTNLNMDCRLTLEALEG